MSRDNQRAAEILSAIITDAALKQGKLIETGWLSFKKMCVTPDATQSELVALRTAFFAGAQHTFGAITTMFADADGEPSEDDMDKMYSIGEELNDFLISVKAKTPRN